MNQLEADKQAYLSRCEQLDVGLEDIRNQLPHDALERKYADAVSRMAGVTCKLALATASENILRVRSQLHPRTLRLYCLSNLHTPPVQLMLYCVLAGTQHSSGAGHDWRLHTAFAVKQIPCQLEQMTTHLQN